MHISAETKSNITVLEKPKASNCSACEGLTDVPSADGSCKCKDDLLWDGSKCVPRNKCPCVENYITYVT